MGITTIYMFLGAWILLLVIAGLVLVVITSAALDDNGEDDVPVSGILHTIYLLVLAITFYSMGVHFG